MWCCDVPLDAPWLLPGLEVGTEWVSGPSAVLARCRAGQHWVHGHTNGSCALSPAINRLQVLRMGEAQAVNYTVAAFEGSTHYALEGTWLASQMHHNFPWLRMSECRAGWWWMVVGGGGLQAGAPLAGFFTVSLLQAAPAPHARWQAGAQSAAAVPLTHCPPCAPSIMAAVVSMREPISQAISMVFHNLDSNRKLVRAGGEAPCLVG